MHAHLSPVSRSSDSADSTCPARPDLQAPQAPATSSPAAAFASTDRSALLTAPAVDPAAIQAADAEPLGEPDPTADPDNQEHA